MPFKIFFLLLSSLLCLGCGSVGDSSLAAHAQAPNVPNQEALRKQVTDLYAASGAKAMLITVRQGEQELLSLALGESMTGVPASLNDHVRIGGVSELFWGTLVMRLVERGDIRLEDKVSKWLPDLYASDQVTLGMLLKNLGGYKDYVVDEEFIQATIDDPFRAFTREEIIAYAVKDKQMNFAPGTQSKYSHTEFSIMGLVIEKATGKSMEELYQELIFKPAGLTNTGYMKNASLPEPALHAFTSDRGVYEDCTYWSPSWTGDSGPLYSTLGDLAKWAPVHGKGQLLTPASQAHLISKPDVPGRDDLYFASGFIVANGWYCQNPSFNGYSGAYGYLPEQDLTVIVYTTQSEDPKSDRQAFPVLKAVVSTLTPARPIDF